MTKKRETVTVEVGHKRKRLQMDRNGSKLNVHTHNVRKGFQQGCGKADIFGPEEDSPYTHLKCTAASTYGHCPCDLALHTHMRARFASIISDFLHVS